MNEDLKGTLPHELTTELERVREIVRVYDGIGPGGVPAATMMRIDIADGERALMMHDAAGMVSALKSLRDWEL